jgi:large subunit ribosomal protein L3
MKNIFIAEKLGMTQFLSNDGNVFPVTVLTFSNNFIVSFKTKEIDGYDAVLVGYGLKRESSINKPQLGYYKKNSLSFFRCVKEFRVENPHNFFDVGSVLSFPFQISNKIDVRSKTIGKGFSGTVKKHRFKRGPMSHGSKNHRLPGSIGAGTTPSNVVKGKKMAGLLGSENVCIKNLELVSFDVEKSLIFLKGAVPGKKGLVFLTKS